MSKPRSLSLAAYRVLSWGVQNGPGHPDAPRPEGELLWMHVATQDRLRVVNDFGRRLQQVRGGLSVLLSVPPDTDLNHWPESAFPIVPLPAENAGSARAFLHHWRPDIGIWVGGNVMPNVITRAEDRAIPLIQIEATPDILISKSARWLPDIARYTFDCFTKILVTTPDAARQIRRIGVAYSKVEQAPPLQISPNPQPWPEDELTETNQTLSGRHVWLAAWVQDKEFISVLSAHRQALRMLPRLTLVLHVADMHEAAPLLRRLESMDLRCTNWDEGGTIEDTTQVILTSEPEDLGLWQRVAPVTFMGSSLERGAGGQEPSEAIALGSAIVHGPFIHLHQDMYARLEKVGAARVVKSATELGDAVVQLLAPDRAADMALAGWQMITEGAPQADQLIDMVQEILDQRNADDAGT
ncbi:MAG: glycosyltransferase N-terminal domain-containing protein [Pseudomonadota bacterium]